MISCRDSQTIKILAVERSRAVRMVIERAFADYDCAMYEAANGKDALRYLEHERPDVILLGTTMHEMDGMETLRWIHNNDQWKTIPILVITGEATLGMLVKMSQLGIHDFIFKPFKEAALVEKVSRMVKLEKRLVGVGV
jgi:CheY-like chemotaxis protein